MERSCAAEAIVWVASVELGVNGEASDGLNEGDEYVVVGFQYVDEEDVRLWDLDQSIQLNFKPDGFLARLTNNSKLKCEVEILSSPTCLREGCRPVYVIYVSPMPLPARLILRLLRSFGPMLLSSARARW